MKNLVNPTKTYVRKIERTFEKGDLISESKTESYTEFESSENIHSTELQNTSNKYRYFNRFLDLILKSEGLISFCCYLKEPLITNFLTMSLMSIGKFLMFN